MKNLTLIVFLFLFSFSAFSQTDKPEKDAQNQGQGSGSGSGSSDEDQSSGKTKKIVKSKPAQNSAIRFVRKPNPSYTNLARTNNVQGVVILEVTFLDTGKIGEIKVIQGLPDGLSKKAVAAAKRIRFEPERKDGNPITVTKKVQYTFTIY